MSLLAAKSAHDNASINPSTHSTSCNGPTPQMRLSREEIMAHCTLTRSVGLAIAMAKAPVVRPAAILR